MAVYRDWSSQDSGICPSDSVIAPPPREPLAVIGLASRFSGDASNSTKLWQMLLEQRSAAGPVPKSRFDADSYYHPDPDHGGTSATKDGYFLDGDIHAFDTSLFNLTANEVASMDAQQKLLLENVFHALENAGLPLDQIAGSHTSVFIGASNNDHLALANADLEMLQKHRATGTSPSILANRVSWFYDLRGTSQTLDTACSSSLVAFHQACTDVQSGQSGMAIVSGVNLIEHPASFMQLSTLGVLSPDGKCFSFDNQANGYGRGEGVGTIIVKPLSAAIRDGNTIRAIVRGTGSNQDGKTPGMSLPSPQAQEALIKQVYATADLDLMDTSYVEAHGTGTPVGDPLEVRAIANAFRIADRASPLHIGSVKANLGHLEGGAGIAGLIKVILMLEAKTIPGLANFERLNPKLEGHSNLVFPQGPTFWSECNHVRRASINSFGFGGTNSHVVLEGADSLFDQGAMQWHRTEMSLPPPPPPYKKADGTVHHTNSPDFTLNQKFEGNIAASLVFALSASDQLGLVRNSRALKDHLEPLLHAQDENEQSRYLADLAYTLNQKRSSLRWKTFHIAGSAEELLRELDTGSPPAFRTKSTASKIGFVFTGQGAQWSKMGSTLLTYPVFRKSIEDASSFLGGLGCPYSVRDLFEHGSHEINHPLLSQTICTVLQVALVDLLASWKVLPCVTVGHSSGEIAAAYCSRKLTRQAAWKIAYYRGLVSVQLHNQNTGGMMAVGASIDGVLEQMKLLEHEFQNPPEIGCFNSSKNVTVTGERAELLKLQSALDQAHIFTRILAVQVPYHSQQMRSVSNEYESLLRDLSHGEKLASCQEVTMVSSLTGSMVEENDLGSARYWVENLTSPVRFSDALLRFCSKGQMAGGVQTAHIDELIEIGPHSTLCSAIREGLGSLPGLKSIEYTHAITRKESSNRTLLATLATIHSRGYRVDLDAVNQSSKPSLLNRRTMTDLPPYSFNHEKSSRTQTRLMKNVRFPRHSRHELLGSPVWDWNDYEPKWRNFLRTSEMPWTRDNQVCFYESNDRLYTYANTENKLNGTIIYPGVSSLIMAMEAARQLKDAPLHHRGYRVRNVAYKAALLIPQTKEGIEVSFSMRRTENLTEGHQPWYEFHLMSFDAEKDFWVEHTSGLVRVEGEVQQNDPDGTTGHLWNDLSLKSLTAAHQNCTEVLDVRDYYRKLDSSGVCFGPTMQNLTEMVISQSEKDIFGKVQVPALPQDMEAGHGKPLIMHPTVMESMAQILLPICTSQESPLGSELLTTFTEEIWVSASVSSHHEDTFQARAWSVPKSSSRWLANMDVWNATQEWQIMTRGMVLVALSQNKESSADLSPCYRVSAKLSTDLLASAADFQSLHQDLLERKDTTHLQQMELMSASFISETLTKVQSLSKAVLPEYQRFYTWMQDTASETEAGSSPFVQPATLSNLNQDREARDQLQHVLSASSNRGKLLVEVGKILASILTGEQNLSSLGHLQETARKEAPWGNIKPLFSQYLAALGENHSNVKVLEVGAGTGNVTDQVLEAIGSSVTRYHFTDATDASFENAQLRLSDWSQKMHYSTLQLGLDVPSENFQAGSYDLVVAAHGVAISDAHKTLNQLRNLLRPGGKLILIESNNPNLMSLPILFGMPTGYLDKTRLQEQELKTLLSQSGFCQNPLVFYDTDEEHAREMALFVSTAVENEATPKIQSSGKSQKCFIVYAGTDSTAFEICSLLKSELANISDLEVTAVEAQYLRAHDLRGSICLSLLGLGAFGFSVISPDGYEDIKQMLLTCRGLIWVTIDTLSNPLASMATGILRTTRSERHFEDVNLITLSFSDPQPAPRRMSESILQLYHASFEGLQTLKGNGEYIFQDGLFWINRLHAAPDVNHFLESGVASQPTTEPLGLNLDTPLKLEMKQPGDPNLFEFTFDPSQESLPLDDQVKIHVESWGLGSIGATSTVEEGIENSLGREATGRVVCVGDGVEHLRVGDRAMTFNPSGALGTYLIVPSQSTQVIPPTTDFRQASGIPFYFCTALYALYEVARLRKGETVLIYSAASGVGQAAVQLASLAKAQVLAVVRTAEEKDILTKFYDLEEKRIFCGEDDSLQAGIAIATQGRGIDVVLRTRGSSVSDTAWRSMAPFGRFLDLMQDEDSFRTTLDMLPFSRGAVYATIDMVKMAQDKPDRVWGALKDIALLYQENKIKGPQPLVQFNFSEIERAVSYARDGKTPGAAILVPHQEDMVPKRPAPVPAYHFPETASYVLAGGLGGLGRSIARWMASRGARNFIFLSRSGVQGESAASFVQELRDRGCRVEVGRCDISKLDVLAETLDSYRSSMPPIRGCFQCSMVLRDSMLSNMSHAQFIDCMTPKVQGSANLARVLPRDLDFLLFLSSSSAIIGNRGQANYSAANMYMDTLAEHLVRDGLRAMSINLGSVLSAGWLADNKDSKLTGALSHLTTSEEELLSLIEYHVDPRWNVAGSIETCHTIAGLRTASYFSRRGVTRPEFFEVPLFQHLHTSSSNAEEDSVSKQDSDNTLKQLQTEADPATVVERISGAVARKLSAMMSIPEEDFEYNQAITSYGVDSLVTMDFRSWVANVFAAKVSTLDVVSGNSIGDLSRKIAVSMALIAE